MRERLEFLVFRGLGSIRGMTDQKAKKQQKYVHAIMTGGACCRVVSLAFSVCAHVDVDVCCVVVQIRSSPNTCVSVSNFLCFKVCLLYTSPSPRDS